MKKTAAILIPVVAVVPVSKLCAALSISVIPPILEISVPPGGEKAFKLTVKNTGSIKVVMTPSVMDLELSPTGAALPMDLGTSSWSCADWVGMDTQQFVLGPGEKKETEVLFKVPRGVSGGRYCVIIFEANPRGADEEQADLAISARTGTIIMESIPRRAVRSGEISEVDVTEGSGAVDIVAYFRNTGNIHVGIRPGCVIRNSDGRIIDRVKMSAGTGTVLPEGTRRISGAWTNERKMEPGTYTAEVSADFKGGRRATQSVQFSID